MSPRAGVAILRKARHICNVNQYFEMPPNISKPVATKPPSHECVEGVDAGRAAASAMIAMQRSPISRVIAKPSVPGKGWGSAKVQIKKTTVCGKTVGWKKTCTNPICSVCAKDASAIFEIDFMMNRMWCKNKFFSNRNTLLFITSGQGLVCYYWLPACGGKILPCKRASTMQKYEKVSS